MEGLTLKNGIANLTLDLGDLLGIDGTASASVDIFGGLAISADLEVLGY